MFLISETHLTNKNNFKIHGYTCHDSKHSDDKAHGGVAILIRQSIPHFVLDEHCTPNLQSITVCVTLKHEKLNIASVYSSPNHKLTDNELQSFFSRQGNRFIAAGDYNAKHTHWGSRLITTRGRVLYNVMKDNGFDFASCGSPTYWPTDPKKIPDLLDFAVTRAINRNRLIVKPLLDLSSDHTPVVLEYFSDKIVAACPRHITNDTTNWLDYKSFLSTNIVDLPLNSESDIEIATETFSELLIQAAVASTPQRSKAHPYKKIVSPLIIRKAVAEKRKARRHWQNVRSPEAKMAFKRSQSKLYNLLHDDKENRLAHHLQSLSPNGDTDYSLWKATKNMKRPQQHEPPIRLSTGQWARSDEEKAETFAAHLEEIFTPNPGPHDPEICLNIFPPARRIGKIKHELVLSIIKHHIKPRKAPGHDQVTGKMIKELPREATRYLTQLFNAVVRTGYIPNFWKKSILSMMLKPGKDPHNPTSYRPISLLPTLSKLLEKAILNIIMPDIEKIIPNHQFGFRREHGTIEQVHRLTEVIRLAFEERKYCAAIFLDVAQAFDKVWHEGLLYKMNAVLPQMTKLLRSYLLNRKFRVRYKSQMSTERPISAGVPQGSVLGPVLYLLYTADLPTSRFVTTGTFADDTAILSCHMNPRVASRELQEHATLIEEWMHKWRIRVQEQKCVQVTFTLNKNSCPPVLFNGVAIPNANEVRYLGVHLDRRLTWRRHIEAKRDQLKLRARQIHWLIGRKSKLRMEYKLLLYKSMLKPIWYYGCQLWQTASASMLDIIERVQSKLLRQITCAPWYIKNVNIRRDLGLLSVKEILEDAKKKYASKIIAHPNLLARNLGRQRVSRLKKKQLIIQ